jgi:hypothetical protein
VRRNLFQELEAAEVGFVPVGLQLNHRFQDFGREGLARMVKGNCHAAMVVGVEVVLVSARLAVKDEAIA